MPHMDTVRPLKPPAIDERYHGVIDATKLADLRAQHTRVEQARQEGMRMGLEMARSRIPFSLAWLSGAVTGALAVLVVEMLR